MPRGGKREGAGRKASKATKKVAKAAAKLDHLAEGLSMRHRLYLERRAAGETKFQSALDAGYAETVAKNAKANIETPDVQKAFAALIQAVIPAEKIVARIVEGLDATETKCFSFQGMVFDEINMIAWSERREYAKMAAEYGEYFQKKIAVTGKVALVTLESLVCSDDDEETD